MFANSRNVISSQTTPHPRLAQIVGRHFATQYRRPIGASGAAAIAAVLAAVSRSGQPLLLDAGCGTGLSSLALAARHPQMLAIGVDKSAARLAVGQRALAQSGITNALLLRCELAEFWMQAAAAGLRFVHQYLLYPNPWPKPDQLMRRWHAHPVFPSIIACGGTMELRCNWRIYAEEFAQALVQRGIAAQVQALEVQTELSEFERKYRASGHSLWRCTAILP